MTTPLPPPVPSVLPWYVLDMYIRNAPPRVADPAETVGGPRLGGIGHAGDDAQRL